MPIIKKATPLDTELPHLGGHPKALSTFHVKMVGGVPALTQGLPCQCILGRHSSYAQSSSPCLPHPGTPGKRCVLKADYAASGQGYIWEE